MTITGNNALTLTDVLVGEVWVCSGQSNMGMTVQGVNGAPEEIAAATYPQMRLFGVAHRPSATPEADTQGGWVGCSPQTVPGFTAVGYFFGRKLHQDLQTPVGLINSSWGGTMAEAWTPRESLEADPDFAPVLKRWADGEAGYPQQKVDFDAKLADWKKRADEAKAQGQPFTERQPNPPLFDQKHHMPASLYNGMIVPLIPFAIRGAIWYQGESNAGRAYAYRKLLPTMIGDWREGWGQGNFPFLIVQLANFMARKEVPGESAWAELREAQTLTAQGVENSGQAVTIDIGEEKDIHPKNKQDVGSRLALIALARTYGHPVEYSGPQFASLAIEGDRARARFTHADGLTAGEGGPLKGFAIAGADRRFVWADATIEQDTVVLSSPEVAEPVAVRYAWADNPDCSLRNAAGLPACPFRTDDWPGVTINSR
jgi:sialate O-acetylesterase